MFILVTRAMITTALLMATFDSMLLVVLQQSVTNPTDWVTIITSQGPLAAIVFWFMFRLENKLENLIAALQKVADNQTRMLVLYETLQETRRARVEDDKTRG